MKRKLLSIFMVVALILTLAPFIVVSAAPPAEDDDEDVEAVTEVEDGEDADDEDDEDADDADDEDGEAEEVEEPEEPAAPADPLDGAHSSLVAELAQALEQGFVPEAMIGNWAEPTSRLLAAEMIVMLIEVACDMSINEVAVDLGLDMSDTFSDTDSEAATFLKAARISNGVDGVRYDPDGKFTRAMMVTMLGRMAEYVFGLDLSGYRLGTDVFTDLPAASYGYANQYVGWASDTRITLGQGVADRFDPGSDLTNQATVAFSLRALGVIEEAVAQMDADGGDDAEDVDDVDDADVEDAEDGDDEDDEGEDDDDDDVEDDEDDDEDDEDDDDEDDENGGAA